MHFFLLLPILFSKVLSQNWIHQILSERAVISVTLAHLEAITTVNYRVNPYLMRFPAQFF